MIRLKTLGALDLSAADGGSVHQIARQPKRLALLAYLAMERPGQFHRRDALLGLLWPESDLKAGRAALSQALHFLRQHVGREAIVTRGDEEIGVAADQVWCDAAAFQALIGERRYEEALALYTGELMPGLYVEQAAGFEQWLEQKRSDLQRAAMNAALALADAAESDGKYGDVVRWLRRAINHSPYEEKLHQRLIGALDMSGDRAAALRAYDELERLLKDEFEIEPGAETRDLIAKVRTRSEAQGSLPGVLTRVLKVDAGQKAERRRSVALIAAAGALLIVVMAWGASAMRRPAAAEAPLNRIAVLYFNDASPTRDLAYLTEGLTSTLIDHLGQVRQLEVISQNGVRPFRGDSVPMDSIARHLDVGTLVGGSVTRSGDRLRVTVEMVRAATGVVARSRTFERPEGELFALLDDIAHEVGGFLRASLGEEVELARYRVETRSVEAWQAVQRAEQLLSEANAAGDRGQAARAADLFARADSLLGQAARLDEKWSEPLIVQARAHEKRAWLAMMGGTPSPGALLETAIAEANQAISREPHSAAAYETRGRLHYVKWLITRPDSIHAARLLQQAEQDLTAAAGREPERARTQSMLSVLYESQGRFELARQAARRALEADAYLVDADQIVLRLFQSSFEVRDDAEAGYWCDEVRRRMSGRWPAAWCDLVLLGWGDQSADPRKALYILETFGARDRAELRTAMRPRIAILAAASVARAGDRARAESMIADARAAAPHDPELLPLAAATRSLVGDQTGAAELLKEYLTKNPTVRPRIENGRMFQFTDKKSRR